VKIRLLGGFEVEHDGARVEVVGTMQRALSSGWPSTRAPC